MNLYEWAPPYHSMATTPSKSVIAWNFYPKEKAQICLGLNILHLLILYYCGLLCSYFIYL